jgi:signal transduction histidine kinase
MLYISSSFAIESLVVGNGKSYEVLPYSEYSAVKKMDESPESLKDNIWHKNKLDCKLNREHEAYWVRIKVKNAQSIPKEFYLMDERRYVYVIDYYLLKNGKVTLHKKDGLFVKENVSSFNSSQRIFPLPLEANEEAEILFKVQNFNMLDMPFKIVTKDYLIEYFQFYSFFQGAFLVVLLVMMVYNFITYLIIRVKAYLYYLGYALLLILYQATYFGYFKIFNLEPIIPLVLLISGGIGFMIFAAYFIRELFHFKQYFPKIDKLFSLIIWSLIVLMLFYIFTIKHIDFSVSQYVFNIISIAVCLYVFIILYSLNYLAYKRVRDIIFLYAMVWDVISLLGLLLIAMHSSIISTDIGIDYLFELGMFIESVLFSLLLSYRIKETEEEKQEQELMLIQQNRLASMGEMISTIAHQWRQPLSQINGRVLGLDIDYKKKRLTDEVMEEHLSDIEQITVNMSGIINDFMNFFNTSKEIETFEINDVISESIRIVKSSSFQKVEIVQNVEEIVLQGYKSELVQAILIVINNAIDAYSGSEMAKIIISVREQEGDVVVLTFKDNGDGVSDEVLRHMFEPYYTTKHKSQGTGLGLYILKMIIENGMGGKAYIKNDEEGATFTLEIPKKL